MLRDAPVISGQFESDARVRTPDAVQSSTSALPGAGDSRLRAFAGRLGATLVGSSEELYDLGVRRDPSHAASMPLADAPSMLATSRAARSRCSLAPRVADSDICRCTTDAKRRDDRGRHADDR